MTTVKNHTLSSRGVILACCLAVLLLLTSGFAKVMMPSASAAENTPAAGEFYAPLCEGTTPSDPRNSRTVNPSALDGDLTRMFGKRLDAYNEGRVVPLYDNTGRNGNNSPSCGVRYVEGIGPVSEWMYCTDATSQYCTTTLRDGSLSQDGNSSIPPMDWLSGNKRLSADEQTIISYILRHDLTYGGKTASNTDDDTRNTRQGLVWCVSDWDHCTEMNDSRQKSILELAKTEAAAPTASLSITPESASLPAGETAELEVTSNIIDKAISVRSTGGKVEVCGGNATLVDNVLTIKSGGTATLCVTSDSASHFTLELEAAGTPDYSNLINWAQSPGTRTSCQVYATFDTVPTPKIRASVEFNEGSENVPAVPATPEVAPGQCTSETAGSVVWQTVTAPENSDAITYGKVVISDDHVATLEATLNEGFIFGELGEGWTDNGDSTATWTRTLTSEKCAIDEVPATPPNEGLAQTGLGSMQTLLAGFAALLLGGGALTVLVHRRKSGRN